LARISEIRSVNVTRYVTPLREGGSLPAIVEADDQFLYVLKFRGAGQGKKALIAELIGGEIARALGFRVPEIVYAELDSSFGRIEGDEEIQDLLKASTGLNLGLHYLSGAITFDPVVTTLSPIVASQLVWLDSLLMNVDRTCRNTNMLMWKKELWLIDHGASLYFHHNWSDEDYASKPFPLVKNHVALPLASELETVNVGLKNTLTNDVILSLVRLIPDQWLTEDANFESVEAHRKSYEKYLVERVRRSEIFVEEAKHARESVI
jgi:hypothetical protein